MVQKIFELRLQGLSLESIERELVGKSSELSKLLGKTESTSDEEYELDDESEYIMGRMDEDGRVAVETFELPKKDRKRTPDLKAISFILNGNGKLKYDGRRQLVLELRFNEDAEAFNRLMESGKPRYRVLSSD